jgi:hypothetical protein
MARRSWASNLDGWERVRIHGALANTHCGQRRGLVETEMETERPGREKPGALLRYAPGFRGTRPRNGKLL